MKKRFYIVFVARDEDGSLRKVPVPMHYAYIFVAAAVVGIFTVTGLAGSYSRMLVKTAHFNQIRQEREALRKDYRQLELVAHEKDVQAASLGSLASEVSALYGLRPNKLGSSIEVKKAASTKAADTEQLSVGTTADFSNDSYYKSLDEFYALRTSAMSGDATRVIAGGIVLNNHATSLSGGLMPGGGEWSGLADAPSLWPVQGPITSSFGEREDPFNGEGAFHKGVDISSAFGTPVRASADGTVESATLANGYGREVILNHGHNMKTLYAHLSGFTVIAGQTVVRGQIIGYVGRTGRSTGAHLHYEVQIHGTPVNPHKYLRTSLADLGSTPPGL